MTTARVRGLVAMADRAEARRIFRAVANAATANMERRDATDDRRPLDTRRLVPEGASAPPSPSVCAHSATMRILAALHTRAPLAALSAAAAAAASARACGAGAAANPRRAVSSPTGSTRHATVAAGPASAATPWSDADIHTPRALPVANSDPSPRFARRTLQGDMRNTVAASAPSPRVVQPSRVTKQQPQATSTATRYESRELQARRALRAAVYDGAGRNVDWHAVVSVAQDDKLSAADRARVLSTAVVYGRDDGYRSVLSVAVEEDKVDYVSLFLARGADPNSVRAWFYDTPLVICASFRGNCRIAELLLAYGANVDGIGIPERRRRHTCRRHKRRRLVLQAIAQSGFERQTAEDDDVDNVDDIAAAALNDADEAAVSTSHMHPDERPPKSVSALGCAAYRGHLPLVNLLLRHGADVHYVESVDGCGVLHLVAQGSRRASEHHVEITKKLLLAGADPTLKDYSDALPADYAREAGDDRLERLLRDAACRHAVRIAAENERLV